MTTFDHRSAGTPAEAWLLDDLAPLPRPETGDRVVVVAAHPDDETLGAGGLIASCLRRGVEVVVVVATDGEASHPESPTYSPAQLAAIRRVEVQQAVEALAPGGRVRFLGLPDGGLTQNRSALSAQIDHFARDATHLVTPWIADGHPDHEACGAAAAEVAATRGARHWQYPIWAWHWGRPGTSDLPLEQLHRVVLTPGETAAKHRALVCHQSQHAPLSQASGDEAILSPQMLAHFSRAAEYFMVGDGAAAPDYFASLYETAADPWGLQERFYEQRKRAIEFASLPRARFRRAFEPGCAIGLLTEQLAQRCDQVVAWDIAERAVQQSRARVADLANVAVQQGRIPDDWPDDEFDLIVLSEVGYYCVDLEQLVARTLGSLTDDGVVLGCHWRRFAPDHPQTAQAVHAAFDSVLHSIVSHVEDDFVLQVWSRSGRSVAAADGIVA